MVSKKLFSIGALVVAACLALAASSTTASAATVLNSGGNVSDSGGWSNGMPSVGNNGTISVNGSYTTGFVMSEAGPGTVAVAHTAGTLSGTANFTMSNSGSAVFNWDQSGGTLNLSNALLVLGTNSGGTNINYTLSGAGLITGAGGLSGGRIQVNSAGSFTQTGGTVTGKGYDVSGASTMLLGGGLGDNIGHEIGQAFRLLHPDARIDISGNYAATVSDRVNDTDFVTRTGGSLVFDPNWSGSFTRSLFTKANWITALTDTDTKVGTTQVSSENFDTYFKVVDGGGAGSNVSLVLVPEPSTLVPLPMAGLGLLCYAWRKRRERGAPV